jgi:hypothetical protein
VIEVSDTSLTFDLDAKARLYAASGIPAYWVIGVHTPCLHRVREVPGKADALLLELRASVERLIAGLPRS